MRVGRSATSGSTGTCGRGWRNAVPSSAATRQEAELARRGCIPGRVDMRPEVVEEKSRVGDWEGDTIVGSRHRGAVLSLVDRASKFTLLALLGSRTARETGRAMRKCLEPYKEFVHTTDNGKEFAAHKAVARALGALFFFAQPYHSWERGLNEHTNGLVRQYFPKATDFRKLDPAELKRVETLLNNRPRKALGYRTPAEVFNQSRGGATGPGLSGMT